MQASVGFIACRRRRFRIAEDDGEWDDWENGLISLMASRA